MEVSDLATSEVHFLFFHYSGGLDFLNVKIVLHKLCITHVAAMLALHNKGKCSGEG